MHADKTANLVGTGTKVSHVRWYLIAWLFVLSAVAFLDRVNISIAGSSLAAAYHLSNVQLGWVFSSFLAGYALSQTPGGRLVDRLVPRRMLAGGVVWWGIFTALTALVPSGVTSALFLIVGNTLPARVRGSCRISSVESICSALDTSTRARNRQWLDLRRSERRRSLSRTEFFLGCHSGHSFTHACYRQPLRLDGFIPYSCRIVFVGRGGLDTAET